MQTIHAIVRQSETLSISHDQSANAEAGWLEVLCDGLTFRLGPFDECMTVGMDGDEVVLLSAGPHLAGGESSLPVLRSMMALGASLCDILPVRHAYWPPSNSLTDSAAFVRAIDSWLAGGFFPVPELIALHPLAGGGMRSEGLEFFTGQEIEISPEAGGDVGTLSRLGIRLLSQLVLQGRIMESDSITGPDGTPLRLELMAKGNVVSIRRE